MSLPLKFAGLNAERGGVNDNENMVWVVLGVVDYEGSWVLGVGNEEQALKIARECNVKFSEIRILRVPFGVPLNALSAEYEIEWE